MKTDSLSPGPSDGPADRSEEQPPGETDPEREATRRIMQDGMEKIGMTPRPSDKGNGQEDQIVLKVKSPRDIFIDSITDSAKRKALVDVMVNGDEMSLLDKVRHLKANRFTEDELAGAQVFLGVGTK